MKHFICAILAVVSMTSSLFALDSSDQDAIHQIIDHFTHVWNNQDGHGSADNYATDAEFVNIFGMAFSGKEEIEVRHIQIHETFLKSTFFEVTKVRLREASSEVVVAHVDWQLRKTETDAVPMMNGVFMHVFLKTDSKWEIIATQNTLAKSPGH